MSRNNKCFLITTIRENMSSRTIIRENMSSRTTIRKNVSSSYNNFVSETENVSSSTKNQEKVSPK